MNKISKIHRIKKFGIFRDFNWPGAGLPQFARFNLFYGWNGGGKTTLSRLFQALATKSTVLPFGDSSFSIEVENVGTIQSGALATAVIPSVRVFNRQFVRENVFTNHKKAVPIFFLGKADAKTQQRILRLEKIKTRLEQAVTRLERQRKEAETAYENFGTKTAQLVSTALPDTDYSSTKFRNYRRPQYFESIERMIEGLTSEEITALVLGDDELAKYQQATQGQPREEIVVPQSPFEGLDGVSVRVKALLDRSAVFDAITSLNENPEMERWISTGLVLHKKSGTTECAFCGNQVPSQRIARLESHFSASYQNLKTEVETEIEKLNHYLQTLTVFTSPDKALFYSEFVPLLEAAKSELVTAISAWCGYLESIVKELTTKLDSLHQATNFIAIAPSVPEWSSSSLVSVIYKHNKKTANFRSDIDAARKRLEQHFVASTAEEYIALKGRREGAQKRESSFVALRAGAIQRSQSMSAKLRDSRKPVVEMNQDLERFLGRKEIVLEAPTDASGYIISRGDGRAAENLSEGERTALAFIYFLTKLRDEGFRLNNGVVVIDDPVSSLDANSIYSAFGFLVERLQNAGQLFILTHNFTLFRVVKRWLKDRHKTDHHIYMLSPAMVNGERSATITEIDRLLRDYESEYHYLFSLVYKGANTPNASMESCYHYPNIARRLLEAFLAFRCPNMEADDYVGKLRSFGFDQMKVAKIYRFLHSHSHADHIDDSPDHDATILLETPEVLRCVLEFMKLADEEHFLGMEAAVTRT